MPKASVSTAVNAKPGDLRSWRNAKRMSRLRLFIARLLRFSWDAVTVARQSIIPLASSSGFERISRTLRAT